MTLDAAEESGKLFVGGLSWDTNADGLKEYFSHYGEVTECAVMKNPETGRSRGFGFVSFRDPDCVQTVLSSGAHFLDGRTIDPKSCNAKGAQRGKREAKMMKYPKVFLGGLPSDVNETLLRHFFSKYGKVVEVVIMYNQERKTSRGNGFRGFGFLSFELEESVNAVVAERFVTINNKKVEVKRAEPRDKTCPSHSATAHDSLTNCVIATANPHSSVPAVWSPHILTPKNGVASCQSETLTGALAHLIQPMALGVGWAAGAPRLPSFPWLSGPSISAVPAAFLASGTTPADAAMQHVLNHSILSSALLMANCRNGQCEEESQFCVNPLVGPRVSSVHPALPSISSNSMNTMTPSIMLSSQSMPSCTTTRAAAFPAFANTPVSASLTIPGLRFKFQNQGFHPYRRM